MGTIIKQGVRLISIWAVIFGVFLYFSNPIVQFLSSNEFVSDAAFNKQASLFMIGYWLMFCTEGSFMCTTGFLFALFKVKWILTINLILYIGMVLVPVYFAVAIHHWNPIIYPALVVVKFCLILAGFYLWYRKKTWAQSVITQLKND
jgi:Na+-driven multidrug efflux pump